MEVGAQEEALRSVFEEKVRAGWLYLDPLAKIYRSTWKGACMTACSHIQPMKDIRKSQERRKSQAMLKELDASRQRRQV